VSVNEFIKRSAFKGHVQITKLSAKNELEQFITRFREKYIQCNLVRIGGEGDGGYLLPDILDTVSYCFSPGVDYTASFEKQLSDSYNIKSYMADASVDKAPLDDENFHFIGKFLGSRTLDNLISLSDWMEGTIGNDPGVKILQMDIEGGEYDVLAFEDSATLASFSVMVIEFHALERLFEPYFLKMFSAIFEKIFKNFSICHVHPNNVCGVAELDGISVPRVMEVTVIRNDLVSSHQSTEKTVLPHPLDSSNSKKSKELCMPEIWWKS